MCVFVSASREVRGDMKCWVVSDTGNKWSVKFDDRDLGGHLDSTLRARAVTFGFRMSAAIPRVRAVAVLPWSASYSSYDAPACCAPWC